LGGAAGAGRGRGKREAGNGLRMRVRDRMVLVVWLCSVGGVAIALLAPVPALPAVVQQAERWRIDLAAHLTLFLWLMLLPQAAEWGRNWGWRLAAVLGALGMGLEGAQAMTGYRTVDGADAAANLMGVALGLWIGRQMGSWRPEAAGGCD